MRRSRAFNFVLTETRLSSQFIFHQLVYHLIDYLITVTCETGRNRPVSDGTAAPGGGAVRAASPLAKCTMNGVALGFEVGSTGWCWGRPAVFKGTVLLSMGLGDTGCMYSLKTPVYKTLHVFKTRTACIQALAGFSQSLQDARARQYWRAGREKDGRGPGALWGSEPHP